MRTIVGVIAVLGLSVAVASAQPPRARGASFRPPEPLGANDTAPGTVARGASEDFPSLFPTTPVARSGKAAVDNRGPAWLSGTDPSVLPAAGSASRGGNVRPLSPAATSAEHREDPFTPPKGLDKLKGAGRAQPASAPQPPEQPTATTPFRGTAADGAPVYAGPPAYRWYGWGTVTPGANQFAPTGQYPKASASWYSITGATPGAFPVPVMNPLRNPPGIDPPAYATAKPATAVASAFEPAAPVQQQLPTQVQPQLQPRPLPVERPEPPKPSPNAESKFVAPPPPVNVPKLTPPPATVQTPPATTPVAMVPVPAPIVPPVVRETAPIVPPAPKPEPVAFVPPTVLPLAVPSPTVPPPPAAETALPFPSVEPAKPVVEVPSQLPISLTTEVKPEEPKRPEPKPEPRREEHLWQAAPEPTQPAPGTWAPAGGRPAVAPAAAPTTVPAWKSGAANTKPIVARAQMGEAGPDPIETLIRQLCQDRAESVEVRWSGTRKIMVCFEVRTAPEAQKLVTDISKRPELSQYQIDFCAVLKK